eukprot:g5365.t1
MGTAPREIEARARARLGRELAGWFTMTTLPEIAADLALKRTQRNQAGAERWLPIQLKASEHADTGAWLRQVKHQTKTKAEAYHGSILLGVHGSLQTVLVVPVHRLKSWDGVCFKDESWRTSWKSLPRVLEQHWQLLGRETPASLTVLKATNRNGLTEAMLRLAFSEAIQKGASRFRYAANAVEFDVVDGVLTCMLTGSTVRCQERTAKVKWRRGEAMGLTISTARKSGDGYREEDVDLMLIHVRRHPLREELLGTYGIPVRELRMHGYAPTARQSARHSSIV